MADDDDGQIYVDKLRIKTLAKAQVETEKFTTKLLRKLKKAKDFDEARAIALEFYQETSPPIEAATMTEQAQILGQFAGHLQVHLESE